MKHKIVIPHCYRWLARNKDEYIAYIEGYIRRSHPGLKPKRVEGRYVICVKK
jgi:hypothetical protein